MCNFLSWIEKGDKVYFLTKEQINSPQGEAIKLRFPGEGELIGHAAIRAYYDIVDGKEKECSDFSAPDNFPLVIVKAIKQGQFGYAPVPVGILRKLLNEDYDAKYKLLNEDYNAKRKLLYEDYDAKYKLLYEDYNAKRKPLNEDYWALVAQKKNRSPEWE